HDRVIVVVLRGERGGELVRAETGGYRERAQVVAFGSDVVGQAAVRARVAVIRLLAQEAEARSLVQDDVVALGRRRPEAEDASRDEEPLLDDPVEQALRVVEELARRGLLEDRRVLALQLPRVEEELPVDVLEQRGEVGLDEM